MGTEAFYTAAAHQVLPTLLIALTVEIVFINRRQSKAANELLDAAHEARKHAFKQPKGTWERDRADEGVKKRAEDAFFAGVTASRWFNSSLYLGLVFLTGEVLAFLALAFRWFNVWTFIGTGICLLIMILAVVLLPVARIYFDDPEE